MSISDFIRNFCALYDGIQLDNIGYNELRTIADHIDDEMVELPRDKDGMPIHVGDEVWTTFNHQANVIRICILLDSALVLCKYPNEETAFLKPYDLTHEYPDSLECIADELEEWSEDNRVNGYDEVFERARQLSDRIRKLAEKEGE